ncbi:hypothetical protein CRENBAI_017359 [Crenichthys baileyi]|uniref:Uncharacterized protein n=1 Tax=Crenichthys baileyi TaxID=28760 RepID=A0AAV9S4N2_9TELE
MATIRKGQDESYNASAVFEIQVIWRILSNSISPTMEAERCFPTLHVPLRRCVNHNSPSPYAPLSPPPLSNSLPSGKTTVAHMDIEIPQEHNRILRWHPFQDTIQRLQEG